MTYLVDGIAKHAGIINGSQNPQGCLREVGHTQPPDKARYGILFKTIGPVSEQVNTMKPSKLGK